MDTVGIAEISRGGKFHSFFVVVKAGLWPSSMTVILKPPLCASTFKYEAISWATSVTGFSQAIFQARAFPLISMLFPILRSLSIFNVKPVVNHSAFLVAHPFILIMKYYVINVDEWSFKFETLFSVLKNVI